LSAPPAYPSLLELNTRLILRGLGDRLGRQATLDDIPDALLDRVAGQGFDWVYWLGVWRTGDAARLISRSVPEWRAEFEALLPDLEERDIGGSCFAVTGYAAAPEIGGNAALLRLRERLHRRGLLLMLDFVPNHVAPDHPWVGARPDLFVHGAPALLASAPGNYVEVATASGTVVLARGRDPNFPGWPDTLQLDYANPSTLDAMRSELAAVAESCDGLRCDMAMLLLPEVFERTWGRRALPFWPEAIGSVRARRPDFVFMAEVYWGLEARLLEQGFDYAYDKTLYDLAVRGDACGMRAHLRARVDEQRRLARFLENHDEERAAHVFAWDKHRAAAVVSFCSPCLRFFHDGQFEGRTKHASVHLNRAPAEPADPAIAAFYARLLDILRNPVLRDGAWTLLEPAPAWDGNWTWAGFIAFAWDGEDGDRLLGVVSYQPHQAQCYLRLRFAGLAGRRVMLRDLLGPAVYQRDGDELLGRGMYFDVPAWGVHLFRVEAAA
jgi:hypothetical protein